jgi:hypothetical protein
MRDLKHFANTLNNKTLMCKWSKTKPAVDWGRWLGKRTESD